MASTSNGVEVLTLRSAAARFIAKIEQEGLDDLDIMTASLYRKIEGRYSLWLFSMAVATIIFVAFLIIFTGFALQGPSLSNSLLVVGALSSLAYIMLALQWRVFQYGRVLGKTPRLAIYANGDKASLKNLDLFFKTVQLETTPRAFYKTKSGARKEITRHYFFGKLRALLLSEDDWMRGLVFAPKGLWFSHELYIEVDIAALIEQAKAKPKESGRPKTYDYTDAVMSLIEHPDIKDIDPDKRGNETRITKLLENWYIAKRLAVPSEGQLRIYAKLILEVIRKNRLSPK